MGRSGRQSDAAPVAARAAGTSDARSGMEETTGATVASAPASVGRTNVLRAGVADVSRIRERTRRRRVIRLLLFLYGVVGFVIYRGLTRNPLRMPSLPADPATWMPGAILVLLLGVVLVVPMVI